RPPPCSTLFPYTTLFRSQEQQQFSRHFDPLLRSEPRARLAQELDFLGRRFAAEDFVAMRKAAEAFDDVMMALRPLEGAAGLRIVDRKSTRLNSSHVKISY